jgi:glycine cleavage system aminomethyltransferase T
MSTFAKIEVEGEGALEFLQYLCTADINRPVGSITYSLMTNEHVNKITLVLLFVFFFLLGT